MLISYNIKIGTAIIVCEKTSGVGDINAPIIKENKITIFRFFIKYFELTKPSFANTKIINGNSKIKPNGIRNEITKSRYCQIENKGCKSTLEKPKKNFIPAGKTK